MRTARIVQLISSGITQDWGGKTPVLKANALTHDIFEAETTASVPTERVGWGTPVRTALTPPVALGKMVTVPKGKVAHPSYRSRLKMRAPVVPTHGWPAGSTEERPPEWGWRLAMERDQRPESTSTPTLERRWTPVARPIDPVAPDSLGWHAKAVRRLAFGRVFAFERNIGIVTLERSGEAWSVRHVIAGELPPLAETGTTPAGLQPYVIHRIALTPQPPATWNTNRPRVRDDGGWGVDATEPALQLLLHWLPLIWRVAAKHVDPFWPDLPANLDEPARDALITKAADKIAGTFRRRVLRELGPFAAMTDAQLDAITEPQIAALANRIGKFEIAKEARALVRPDLERMMNLDSAAADRAAFFDDVLLIACSDWVNERNGLVSLIAGLLATFRSPITRHFPVLAGLLGGLWDRWRFGTNPEYWTPSALPAAIGGLVSLPPRIGAFVREMLSELLIGIIEDHNPRREGGPPIFPPELALAVVGAVFSLKFPKRMTTVSGWEDLAIPVAPGARRGDPSPLTLARQTLSLLVHPGNRARFVAPAQRFSLTLIPPADALSPGNAVRRMGRQVPDRERHRRRCHPARLDGRRRLAQAAVGGGAAVRGRSGRETRDELPAADEVDAGRRHRAALHAVDRVRARLHQRRGGAQTHLRGPLQPERHRRPHRAQAEERRLPRADPAHRRHHAAAGRDRRVGRAARLAIPGSR